MTPTPSTAGTRIDRYIFVLVIIALIALWAAVATFTYQEREFTLEQARSQLEMTVITLADFNELAAQSESGNAGSTSDARTDALWRALLQYPAASIWVESGGSIVGGMPAESTDEALVVEEVRNDFTVSAALPYENALANWERAAWQRSIFLILTSAAFLVLTHFLVTALRQRALSEAEAAAVAERNKQLSLYRSKLEITVAERTSELEDSKQQLEQELVERKAAERTLREHDAMLSSVAKAAGELLGSHQHEEAINSVLELTGKAVAVSRVQLNEIRPDEQGHLHMIINSEWFAPGLDPEINDRDFHSIDINTHFGKLAPLILGGNVASFHLDDIATEFRDRYRQAGMYSFLMIPVYMEEKLWGTISFIDANPGGRVWNWAETDTLKTLGGLIGVAMTRARYVQELADANMIVQNSPTILYRLKGDPSFPLVYISHNITKFGHDAEDLEHSKHWISTLVATSEDQEALRAAMSNMMNHDTKGAAIEFRLRTGDGGYRWVENRYTPVRDKEDRLIEVEGIIIDITERKNAEEKIAALARTDALTGLANRATFTERLRQSFVAAGRGAKLFAVHYLDLDHFKTINDTLGHPVGDKLLKAVADRLLACTREIDLVARLGGDEFAILQTEMSEPEDAGVLAQKVIKAVTQPYYFDENELHITTSIGISPYTPDSESPDNILVQADLALYRSKEAGRNQYHFHSGDLDKLVLERNAMAEELQHAIDKRELELCYQAQVSMDSSEVVAVKAMIQWRHPHRGLLQAPEFIPVAEKTGSIMAIGYWMLNEACQQLHAWQENGIKPSHLTLALTSLQLKNAGELIRNITEITEKWELEPGDLEFDVTEAMLAQATWNQNDVLFQLSKLGYKIAIDNFGTEYSSFDYLRSYSVSHLKISRPMLARAMDDPEWRTTIQAIIHLAKEMGICVIAEGIESEDQRQLLLSLSTAASARGYYYSEALDSDSARDVLSRGRIGSGTTEEGVIPS